MVSEYTPCLMAETGTSTGRNGTESSGRKTEKENTPRLVLVLVHTLTTDDEYTHHATLAACYQLAQSVLKIGFALTKRVVRVGGMDGGDIILSTWQLP